MDTRRDSVVRKTMTLFVHDADRAAWRFAEVVGRSALRSWRPGDPSAASGRRLLIGVATYSVYDMRLLDVLDEAMRRADSQALQIDVFDIEPCRSHTDFSQYIPGVGKVFQTPVFGIWVDGRLQETAQGAQARKQILRLCGLDACVEEEITDVRHLKGPNR